MNLKNTPIAFFFVLATPVLLVQSSHSYAHSGTVSNAAWTACENKTRSTDCEYTGFHKERYIGSCQIMAGKSMCVRNQPIEYPETPDEH